MVLVFEHVLGARTYSGCSHMLERLAQPTLLGFRARAIRHVGALSGTNHETYNGDPISKMDKIINNLSIYIYIYLYIYI